jgi:hypothetical protein
MGKGEVAAQAVERACCKRLTTTTTTTDDNGRQRGLAMERCVLTEANDAYA